MTGLIFHSDQGWQYQHSYYRKRLSKQHIVQSMSRKGNCYDNSIMETFFGRMKNEMYYGYEKIINLLKNSRMQLKNIFTTTTTKEFRKNKMDATCKIQDGIHMPRIIKKCVQDSGYISVCSVAFCLVIIC